VSDPDLETLVDQRASSLIRQFDASSNPSSGPSTNNPSPYNRLENGRGQIVVQFLERKRRKGWFGGKGEEELPWETWILDVTLATPRTENEAVKARRAMESSLQKTAMKVVGIVNRDRNHIPPITTNETNPFPYQILVNPRSEGWGQRF